MLLRRSVVRGSCWMVWCSMRARSPALLVMAVLTLRSCSNSSSSLYHCLDGEIWVIWNQIKTTMKISFEEHHWPLWHAPGPLPHVWASPSCNACCTCVSRPCNTLQSAQTHYALVDIHTPHLLRPEKRKTEKWFTEHKSCYEEMSEDVVNFVQGVLETPSTVYLVCFWKQ